MVNNHSKLWVIPNEEEILQEVYEKDVLKGVNHLYYLQEFSDIYKLGFKFSKDDYHTAPCEIARLGHMVVKPDNELSLVICYLPERITDRQCNWLFKNSYLLREYVQVNGYSLQVLDENGICWKKLHGIDEIMMESRKKNLLSEKGMKR